jgi:hypothetical protein
MTHRFLRSGASAGRWLTWALPRISLPKPQWPALWDCRPPAHWQARYPARHPSTWAQRTLWAGWKGAGRAAAGSNVFFWTKLKWCCQMERLGPPQDADMIQHPQANKSSRHWEHNSRRAARSWEFSFDIIIVGVINQLDSLCKIESPEKHHQLEAQLFEGNKKHPFGARREPWWCTYLWCPIFLGLTMPSKLIPKAAPEPVRLL